MRIGVYGQQGYPTIAAFATGLAAMGHRVSWHRPNVYTRDMAHGTYGAVVAFGMHGAQAVVRESYQKLHIPVIVVDLGYLRRDRGTSQVGLGQLCWIPPFPCPIDRFRALEVDVQPAQAGGEFILIAGQRPKDASHGLGLANYATWLTQTVTRLRAVTSRPIHWRPHPRDPEVMPTVPVDRISHPAHEKIDAAMQGAACVVTYNSTVGTEAIVAGLPVVCDPSAMYAPWAETDLARIDAPNRPTDEARLEYLARVGYAQWTTPELASGEACRFILGVAEGAIPVRPAPTMADAGALTSVGGNLAGRTSDTPTNPIAPKRPRKRKAADVLEVTE